jgi:TATA-binding protein-associated factor
MAFYVMVFTCNTKVTYNNLDMGLGKTLQAICILAGDIFDCEERWKVSKDPKDQPLPSLVVCPTSVTGNS